MLGNLAGRARLRDTELVETRLGLVALVPTVVRMRNFHKIVAIRKRAAQVIGAREVVPA